VPVVVVTSLGVVASSLVLEVVVTSLEAVVS
jgi:hypothetical protein